MRTGLADQVVIVTGATANIGRAIALAFAEEGARVVVVGRDVAQGERVVKEARSLGARDAMWRKTDVLNEAEVASLTDYVLACFGAIDVLVNNVGGNSEIRDFATSTPEQWRYDLDINVTTTLLCARSVLPHMIARGSGRIINVGSMSGIIGDRKLAAYSAAKGAVHSFTKVLAAEVGPYGVTVNAVAPHSTVPDDASHISSGSRFNPLTGVFTQTDPAVMASIDVRKPVLRRRAARPSEIGAAAVFLASEGAAFITGHILCVDGGARVS